MMRFEPDSLDGTPSVRLSTGIPRPSRLVRLFGADALGPPDDELREAQRAMILSRVVVIAWLAELMIPLALLTYAALIAPSSLAGSAIAVAAGMGFSLLMILLIRRGVFRRQPHLAMLLLVGCCFGLVASHSTHMSRGDGGNFFLSFFLIYTALVTLFPANLGWMLATFAVLAATYVQAHVAYEGWTLDVRAQTDLLYLFYLAVLGAVLNRVNVRMFFDERRARAELRRMRDTLFSEMQVARDIQTLLLPDQIELPDHQVAGAMVPAIAVGGDYYDVLGAGNRRFLAVGDVSGHGVTTGLTMMMVRSSLVGILAARPDAALPEVYARLNGALRLNLQRMGLRLYMTLALVEVMGGGHFRAVGGHLPALVWRRTTARVEEIELSGVWLGVLDTISPETLPVTEIALGPGDTMLLYTDGVVERIVGDEIYGWDRLKKMLATGAAPAELVRDVILDVERFGGAQDDDMTLLAVRFGTAV